MGTDLAPSPATPFYYHNGQLFCEGVALADIATAVGTPTYVYSQTYLQQQAAFFRTHQKDGLVCYAVKANNNLTILRLLATQGLGADVTSGGELFLALQAGMAPETIIFSGVGKRRDEIEMALAAGIRALHVESAMELEQITAVATHRQQVAPIGVRVNPNIHADTHPYITTGQKSHKFGVSPATAVALFQQAQTHPFLQPVGIAAHIGSQITAVAPFGQSARFLVELADELTSSGIRLNYIDVGGGLGIAYEETAVAPDGAAWLTAVCQPVADAGYELVVEPGRSLVGPAGVLLSQVTYNKVSEGGQPFVIVDAGMNDLLRPALYQAYHPIWPLRQTAVGEATAMVDVVGPICETGDWLAKGRPLPMMQAGDLLAIGQAGAYGYAMASNYNGRLKPAEVLVCGQQYRTIRTRQTYEALLST